jgi:hypothetical protein
MALLPSAIRAVLGGMLGARRHPGRITDSHGGNALEADDQQALLLPPLCRALLYKWWVLIILVQWGIVVPVAASRGLAFRLPPVSTGYRTDARLVPFTRDFFFIVWNLLPLGLAFCTWLIEAGVSRVFLATVPAVRGQAISIVQQTLSWLKERRLLVPVLGGGVFVAVLGTAQQFLKVQRWHRTGECVYWWDSIFSWLIFDVRLAALAANLFCIVVDVAALLLLLIAFARLAHSRLWKLDLLHVDGCGGIAEYGRTALAFTTIPFLVATCGLLGYFDHRAAGMLQSLGDVIMLVLATAFGTLTFTVPLRPIHTEMLRAKAAACASLQRRIDGLGSLLPPVTPVEPDSDYLRRLRRVRRDRELLVKVHVLYAKAPTWPLNLAIGARILGTVTGPLTVFLVDQIMGYLFG